MFQGASFLALDAKGRLSVPTRHREALGMSAGAQITLTKHPHGCLMIFPFAEWESFRARIAALPMQAQWCKRIFLGHAVASNMDAAGRLLVAPELRKAAGIGRQALLLGLGQHFELWDAQTYAAEEAQQMKGEMPDVFKDFSF